MKRMVKKVFDNKLIDDQGFSIVEVLVAVAILAAVFIPVMRSFSTASLVNSKAQKSQSVTSLSEDIMEEVKGKSIQELHDEASTRSDMNFSPLDDDGTLTIGNLKNVPPYVIDYTDITVTQGLKYDVKVTIDTEKYSKDKSGMSPSDEGYEDISDANVRELPKISKVDSHKHAVLSWEINQYDDMALKNLAAENAENESEISSLESSYFSAGVTKNINITIKSDADSSQTKVACEVEYATASASDKSLKYLVYSGYFDEATSDEVGPNVYLFYTLSEKVAPSAYCKTEKLNIHDETTDTRHNVYLIMQDGEDKLNTGTSQIYLNVSGDGWSDAVNLGPSSIIDTSSKVLFTGPDDKTTRDDVIFYSNLMDKNSDVGELFDKASKNRIYYITVDVMKHGETDIIETFTSTMQTGKEADK